jgi:hypothetical protein
VRKFLIVTIVGMALLSCNSPGIPATQGTTPTSMAYGPRGQIDRVPLSPPAGYAPAPTPTSPAKGADMQAADHLGWHASPRWAAVKGDNCIEVEQDPQAASQVGTKRC